MAQILEPGTSRDSVIRKVTAVWIQLPHIYVVKKKNLAVAAVTHLTPARRLVGRSMIRCRPVPRDERLGAQPPVILRPQSLLVVCCLRFTADGAVEFK